MSFAGCPCEWCQCVTVTMACRECGSQTALTVYMEDDTGELFALCAPHVAKRNLASDARLIDWKDSLQ